MKKTRYFWVAKKGLRDFNDGKLELELNNMHSNRKQFNFKSLKNRSRTYAI